MIMDRLDYKIVMMGLLIGPDSHYEKTCINATNTAHREIRNQLESRGQMLSNDRNGAGGFHPENTNLEPWSCLFLWYF